MSIIALDISGYQENVAYSKIEAGYVIIKDTGSNGSLYVANLRQTHTDGCLKAGKKVAFYHFAGGAATPEEAADFAYSHRYRVGALTPIILDIEAPGDGTAQWSGSKTARWVKRYREHNASAHIIAYLNASSARDPQYKVLADMDVDLWVAGYGPNDGIAHQKPEVPSYWNVVGWQYTSVGHDAGVNGNVDKSILYEGFFPSGTTSNVTPPKAPATPVKAPTTTTKYITYTVKSGDSLSRIAAAKDVSWTQIATLNHIAAPYTIYPGQVLKIGVTSSAVKSSAVATMKTISYTVRSGDTLTGIASKYKTTWQTIYADNKKKIGTDPNNIRIGTVLTIHTKK